MKEYEIVRVEEYSLPEMKVEYSHGTKLLHYGVPELGTNTKIHVSKARASAPHPQNLYVQDCEPVVITKPVSRANDNTRV